MFTNRFRSRAAPTPTFTPAAFVLCPFASLPGMTPELASWQQALYQQAFAEAQAVVAPSLPERDLLGVWN